MININGPKVDLLALPEESRQELIGQIREIILQRAAETKASRRR